MATVNKQGIIQVSAALGGPTLYEGTALTDYHTTPTLQPELSGGRISGFASGFTGSEGSVEIALDSDGEVVHIADHLSLHRFSYYYRDDRLLVFGPNSEE